MLSYLPSIMQIRQLFFAIAIFVLHAVLPANGEPLNLILPTSNTALLSGDGPSFYQYTDRYFDGVRSRPWEGGQYGFVRNPKHTSEGLIYTRLHEGVDIKPVYRDRNGEPLDTVRAIDDGFVVYVNNVESHSSYGKYVVVEHWWSGSPFYSLYAHLNAVYVNKGQRVFQADRLGRMGYTGRGIDRRRSHLHFEINMMLNEGFEDWHGAHYRSTNRHGMFNGINLAGLDVADLYESLNREPTLTIDQFIMSQPAAFTIAIPNEGPLDLTYRYGWLESSQYPYQGEAGSWEVSFTATGLPIRVEASAHAVSSPAVTHVRRSNLSYSDLTNGRVDGSRDNYYLSRSGRRYAALLSLVGRERPVVNVDRPAVREVSDTGDERLRTW